MAAPPEALQALPPPRRDRRVRVHVEVHPVDPNPEPDDVDVDITLTISPTSFFSSIGDVVGRLIHPRGVMEDLGRAVDFGRFAAQGVPVPPPNDIRFEPLVNGRLRCSRCHEEIDAAQVLAHARTHAPPVVNMHEVDPPPAPPAQPDDGAVPPAPEGPPVVP